MRKFTFSGLLLLILFSNNLFSQNKQANTVGSELYADAPYRMKKYNNSGHLNGIPIHFYIHDSECFGCNNELENIQIKLKSAFDHNFGSVITFNNLSDSAFNNLLSCRSAYDNIYDIMDFNASGFQKSSSKTISFNADHNIFGTYYVDITHRNWYFTLTIPEDKLVGLNNIIDIEVNFSLALETDQKVYLRVFRYDDEIPKIPGWYRGDTHYHSFFTQNTAENGLPMSATKLAAKYVDLDWITLTDHSCDFDNYGANMASNWQNLGNMVNSSNLQDSSFIFIRGVEMSVNNSDGKIIHALAYPSPSSPLGMKYFGDGGGDLSSTNVSINGLLDSTAYYGGFVYAAHPFAEKDALSSLVNGGLWNIGNSGFPANGQNFPSAGTVGCNDLSKASDLFSTLQNKEFKDALVGGEIWNLRNSVSTTDDPNNPYNALYSTVTPFVYDNPGNSDQHIYRFFQGYDVSNFFLQNGLIKKNLNLLTNNWKFFISAGSDAHGSFNYSNTDLTMGVYGTVNDNAIGRLSTLVYSPEGMGHNGTNVLKYFKKGRTVLSDGPVIIMGLSTDSDDQTMEINIGEDTVMTNFAISATKLIINTKTTFEFGDVDNILLTGITKDSTYFYNLPVTPGIQVFNLDLILHDLFGQIPNNEYFLIKASMTTSKSYGNESDLYKKSSEPFHGYTNPIWIKQIITTGNTNNYLKPTFSVYPNPACDKVFINFNNENLSDCLVKITDISGRLILELIYDNKFIDVASLPEGFYLINIITGNSSVTEKFIISRKY